MRTPTQSCNSVQGFLSWSAVTARTLGIGLAVAAGSGPACAPSPDVPDLILHSGKILTVDANFSVASALAIRNGRILAVGESPAIQSLAGPQTRILDLDGRTVIPGLIDSHSHPDTYGMHLFRPDLSKAASVAEMMTLIEQQVARTPRGEWITNSGFWNETRLEEGRNPTRFDLDSVAPDHPVFLGRGHLAVVNSAAFERLGVSKETPDPEGGAIERDAISGKLTGRLYETAIDPFRQALPAPTIAQLKDSWLQSLEEMAAAGVTSVRSAGSSADGVRAAVALHQERRLPLRVAVSLRLNPNLPLSELRESLTEWTELAGTEDDRFQFWGVKMVADGGSDLAYLRRDYVNRPGFRGQLGGTRENFFSAARLCQQLGLRLGIHALGDAAIDFVLDVYERADQQASIQDRRWSLEHAYLLQPEHYQRIRALGLIVHPQTWHFYNLRRNFLENYGRDYADSSHPYRKLLEEQIPIAGGTDWRLAPSDQFFYIWVAISRKTLDGEVVGPGQALSREEALRLHTLWAASSTFEESIKGSLEPGKLADLIVLSSDYLEVPEEEIASIRPVLTLVGGKEVYRHESWLPQ